VGQSGRVILSVSEHGEGMNGHGCGVAGESSRDGAEVVNANVTVKHGETEKAVEIVVSRTKESVEGVEDGDYEGTVIATEGVVLVDRDREPQERAYDGEGDYGFVGHGELTLPSPVPYSPLEEMEVTSLFSFCAHHLLFLSASYPHPSASPVPALSSRLPIFAFAPASLPYLLPSSAPSPLVPESCAFCFPPAFPD
jgi:hypothetical protein